MQHGSARPLAVMYINVQGRRQVDQGEFPAALVRLMPGSDAAPEAQYWEGVSRYRGSGDAGALKATADAFRERYSDSTWAKKASIWAA